MDRTDTIDSLAYARRIDDHDARLTRLEANEKWQAAYGVLAHLETSDVMHHGTPYIEPKPQDGRRVENAAIANLQQQVAELTERVDDTNNDMTIRTTQIIKDLYNLCDRMEAVESPTPPQPAAECPKCGNTGTITKLLTGYGISSKPCDCGRAPVLMNQPVADEMRFTEDGDRIWGDYFLPDDAEDDGNSCSVCGRPVMWGSRHRQCGEYAMKHSIDPNDPDLLDVVSEAMNHHPDYIHKHRDAKRILSALAVELGGDDA